MIIQFPARLNVDRVSDADANPEPTFEELLTALRQPEDMDATEATLLRIEKYLKMRPDDQLPSSTELRELACVLMTKMYFYLLVLTAQNFLIRDMRGELLRRGGAPPAGD